MFLKDILQIHQNREINLSNNEKAPYSGAFSLLGSVFDIFGQFIHEP